jgi:hypothetical protein
MCLAWCFFLLATRFFDCLVMLVVSSFDTLVAGFELVPEKVMPPCAKAVGDATIRAVIRIPGIVNFM